MGARSCGWDQNRLAAEESSFPRATSSIGFLASAPCGSRVSTGMRAGSEQCGATSRAHRSRNRGSDSAARIRRDAAGALSGVLIDHAMTLVEKILPVPSESRMSADILTGQALALRDGLTEVHEMGLSAQAVRVYEALDRSGELRIRVRGYFAGNEAAS